MTSNLEFWAACPRGTESLVADELRALSCKRVRPLSGGVTFGGPLWSAYRALLWSRVASRVLLTLARVPAATSDELYDAVAGDSLGGARRSRWHDRHRRQRGQRGTAQHAVHGGAGQGRHRRPLHQGVRPAAQRQHDAIRTCASTWSSETSAPPSRSTCPDSRLHRRGYREPGTQVEAPMKETLAAAVLLIAGWPAIAAAGGSVRRPAVRFGHAADRGGDDRR